MQFIGINLLKSIDARHRKAFPEHSTLFFAGRSVILVDELGQLPPIMDKHGYACDGPVKELWRSFTKFVTLDTLIRKDGQRNDHNFFSTSFDEFHR
jgi:hypothetical protein